MAALAPQTDSVRRRKARVRIADVAVALGLTKSTVSRALNGYSDIAETTRLRVQRKAEAMGYRPLSLAQAIRTGRARSLGLVLQSDVHDAHRPFLAEFLAGMTQSASAQNWTLTVATAHGDDEMRDTFDRLLDERKADGFVLPRTLKSDPRIHHLLETNVPFILYGRTADETGCAWFDIRSEDATRSAVRRLADLGHQRIGYVGGRDEHTFSALRRDGYLRGLEDVGQRPDSEIIRSCAVSREEGAVAAQALMHSRRPPTAVVFAVDMAAIGAFAALRSLGLKVGRDVSIISYDGIPEAAYTDPPLTTFSVDTRAAGSRLAEMLIERIRGTAPEDLRETVAARLCSGGSDGPPCMTSEDIALHVHNQTIRKMSKREETT